MSNIDFVLTNLVIRNTRSSHQDTNYVAVAITRNGSIISSQVSRLGDQNSGTHPVNLTVTFPTTYVATDRFVFSYIVVNHGGDTPFSVSACCRNALNGYAWNSFNNSDAQIVAVGQKLLPACMSYAAHGRQRDAWWAEVKSAFRILITSHCDGPVIMDSFSFTGGYIPQVLAAARQSQPANFDYPGIDSPGGCGSNSDYSIRWYAGRR